MPTTMGRCPWRRSIHTSGLPQSQPTTRAVCGAPPRVSVAWQGTRAILPAVLDATTPGIVPNACVARPHPSFRIEILNMCGSGVLQYFEANPDFDMPPKVFRQVRQERGREAVGGSNRSRGRKTHRLRTHINSRTHPSLGAYARS